MRRSFSFVVFAACLLSVILVAEEARACMREVLEPEEQLRESDAVFSGEVVDVEVNVRGCIPVAG